MNGSVLWCQCQACFGQILAGIQSGERTFDAFVDNADRFIPIWLFDAAEVLIRIRWLYRDVGEWLRTSGAGLVVRWRWMSKHRSRWEAQRILQAICVRCVIENRLWLRQRRSRNTAYAYESHIDVVGVQIFEEIPMETWREYVNRARITYRRFQIGHKLQALLVVCQHSTKLVFHWKRTLISFVQQIIQITLIEAIQCIM